MIPTPQPTQLTPPQVFEQAKRLMAMGDYHEAAQRAALLRSHFPNDTPMLALHGLSMGALHLHELAIDDLSRAADDTHNALVNGSPDNPNRTRIADQLLRVCAQLARSHEALGNTDAADAALQRAVDTDPESPAVVLAQVDILAGRGQTAQARSILEAARKLGLEEVPAAMADAAIFLAEGPKADRNAAAEAAGRLKFATEQVGLDAATLSEALRRTTALFDLAGDFDEAYRAAVRAANFRRGNYDAAVHAKLTNAIMSTWTGEAMARVIRPQGNFAHHIFLFGAPNSGAEQLARAPRAPARVRLHRPQRTTDPRRRQARRRQAHPPPPRGPHPRHPAPRTARRRRQRLHPPLQGQRLPARPPIHHRPRPPPRTPHRARRHGPARLLLRLRPPGPPRADPRLLLRRPPPATTPTPRNCPPPRPTSATSTG
jgi:tetratricopeptide (TPR) repeat protein